ncbi:Aldehyde dehydrogenase family [Popillia japonica]|uniref:Aldehyde dehydrogenase n=1 Tax=Popillia japonica TaxID=7064 RepID=A0AAW1HU12_POPJA
MIPRVKLSDKSEKAENIAVEISKPKSGKTCVSTARRAFDESRTKTIKFREKQLKQLLKMYTETESEMVEAINKDLRRPKHESYIFEIDFIKNDLKNVLANFKDWVQPESAQKKIIFPLDTLRIYNDPLGVILLMGAWNYPLQASLLPIASAIASGNCFVLHPSPISSHAAAYIAENIPKYLDQECYQIYTGDVKDILKERFDYIFYIGQKYLGTHIAKAAAIYKTPITLVMGGKNPVYLDDSADMEISARRIMWGKCVNSGQTCIGPEYLLCTKSTEQKFIKAAEKALREFYTEDPKTSPHFARIISDKHFEKLLTYLEEHTVALGGQFDKKERYMQPTILTNVNPNSSIMDEEIYGPILPIITVDNIQKAIAFINAREKPLSMYIFSKNRNNIKLMLESTSAGGVTVNDTLTHIISGNLPFGGVGHSGMGSYLGKKTFDSFVHKKSVFIRPQNTLWEKVETLRYPPYSEKKRKLLSFALAHRPDMPWRYLSYVAVFMFGVLLTLVLMIVLRADFD